MKIKAKAEKSLQSALQRTQSAKAWRRPQGRNISGWQASNKRRKYQAENWHHENIAIYISLWLYRKQLYYYNAF